MKKLAQNKAITLIALVVTVIILLILAGVSVSMLIGNNGVLKKAGEAADQTKIAGNIEELKLYYMEKVMEAKRNVTIEEYLDYLENQQIVTTENEGEFFAEVDSSIYQIIEDENENLDIEYVKAGKITAPKIQKVEVIDQTENSLSIKVAALRMGGGTYHYYISTSEENFGSKKGSNQTGEFTFSDLTQDVTYYIKVVAENNEEQSSKITKTKITPVPDAILGENINYDVIWSNGKVTVAVTTTEKNFSIETSLDSQEYSRDTTIRDLDSGSKIYVRLTNGKYNGQEVEIKVVDVTKPSVTVYAENITTKSIDLKVNAKDLESGLTRSKPFKYYISDSASELDTVTPITDTTGSHTFNNLNQNTTYYIKVVVEDVVGNIAETTVTAVTKLIPTAETGITRNIKWNANGSAEIELLTETDFEIIYKTAQNEEWQKYDTKISTNNGKSIIIALTDGYNYGEEYTLKIEDNIGPNVRVTVAKTASSTIEVDVGATDAESGMPEKPRYNYYIKKDGEKNYRLVEENLESAKYIYKSLEAETTFNIKVTVQDLIGNIGEGSANATTSEISIKNGNITFSEQKWINGKAEVTVTNNTENNMQYQILEENGSIGDSWTTTTNKTEIVPNLKNKDTIVVRLYDGTNATAGYATHKVEDNVAPEIESVTGNQENWTKEDITLTINAKEEETGLQEKAYSFDGGTTWQAENTKTYSQNTQGIVIKVRDIAGNITTYNTINITKIDKTGPNIKIEAQSKSDTITVKITELTDSGVGLETIPAYKYYIATTIEGLDTATPETSNEKTKTFTGLEKYITYYVKVEAQDKLGNTSYATATTVTGSLDVDISNLSITDATWENKEAKVNIKNTSNYNIQYQIVKQGQKFNLNGEWTTVTEKQKEITGLKHEDTVYARLTDGDNDSGIVTKEIKDEKSPVITEITGNPVDWTKDDVTLTINAQEEESGLQEEAYSFDGGTTWQEENTKTYLENTQGIVIKVRDIAGNVTTYKDVIDITKIDKTGPTITIQEQEVTTKSITVKVAATDSEAGLPEDTKYEYIIKQNGSTKTIETSEDTHTFDNLKFGTKYEITVNVKDALENIGTKSTEITTTNLLYAAGDINFSKVIWSNSIAIVTMNNKVPNYDMQYQIVPNKGNINLDEKWTTVKEKTIDIKDLKDGDVIYARLTDGVNASVGYATGNVDNPGKEEYTESEMDGNSTRKDYNILGISVTNKEIKTAIEEEQENASLYLYYYKTINDDSYKLVSTNTYANDPAVISDIDEGATYKIKVMVMDQDRNVTRCSNTATVIANNQATTNTTYAENRTYIDNSKTLNVRTSIESDETTEVPAGNTVTLPASFKISSQDTENKQKDGIVVSNASQDEYVWIPVDDAINDEITPIPVNTGTVSRTYKPMATRQSGDRSYYEGVVYNYNGQNSYRNTNMGLNKSGAREPSLITGNANDGYTWKINIAQSSSYDAKEEYCKGIMGFDSIKEYGEYENSSYTNLVTSVDSYGGFYVGRYETTKETDSSNNVKVGSKANSPILSENNWYRLNLYQDSLRYSSNPYNKISSVESTMMFGSQWDSMLNYILKGNSKDKVTATKWVTQANVPNNSKQDEKDVVNNIYDLAGNAYEWTREATGTSQRAFRGGSYDATTSGSLSSKGGNAPTDQGPILGTRLSLYVRSTNDVTGSTASITKISATSNTITVEATATDKETGVSKYIYYISEDGTNWKQVAEIDTNIYTYTKLKQETNYHVKVAAKDGAGNVGKEAVKEQRTGRLDENIAKNGITVKQIYGTSGNGILKLELDKALADSGYYIQYKVLEASESDWQAGEWSTGDIVEGLSNGKKVYATIFDGINCSNDAKLIEVNGLEEYKFIDNNGKTYTQEEAGTEANKGKTTYDTTIKYTDTEGNIAYIPAGFKVGIADVVNKVNNGLVVQDLNGNEFVWVPVENVLETDKSTTSAEKAMARYQTGSDKYYEGITYNYSGTTSTKISGNGTLGTSSNREPSLVTAGADYSWNIPRNSAKGTSYDTLEQYYKKMQFGTSSTVNAFTGYTEFGQYMNEEYANMVKSVNNYGGFYIGRYELSLNGVNTNVNSLIQSQLGKDTQNNISWYKAYYYQDSKINKNNPYNNSNSVVSSMVWESQWDAIMNWMLKDDKTKEFVTKTTGNHTDKVAKTGAYSDDMAKNIFDLASNVTEWTQGAQSTQYRNYRGGYATPIDETFAGTSSASSRIDRFRVPTIGAVYKNSDGSEIQINMLGSRTALYLKHTTDTTEPTIEILNTTVGTNNIEISVNATDAESGIDKYKFYISEYNFQDADFDDSLILQETTSYGSTCTFEGLTQNQTYYIKAEVYNGTGKVATAYTEEIKTNVVEITEDKISVRFYGKSGEGTGYFEINDEKNLVNEGYYLQHIVVKDGQSIDNINWNSSDVIKGEYVKNLSENDIIITRIYDGKNAKQGFYKTSNVDELERFSEVYTKTTKYEDIVESPKEDGTTETIVEGTAYIPAGFKRATSSITNKIVNGLVIEDEKGNQYVWIPVKNAVYDEKTTLAQSGNSSTYKPMARYQSGYNVDSTNQYFEGIPYNYSGTRSYVQDTKNRLGVSTSYREPSLVTNSTTNLSWVFASGNDYDATNYTQLSELGITSATVFGQYMNNQFTDVVKSIKKYGGFYVGRYEASSWETDNWETGGTNRDNTGNIIKSVPKATPMGSTNWYKMYVKQDSNYALNPYHNSTGVKSSMIWGSQYDAMLNYILEGTDKAKVTKIIGNHTDKRSTTGQFGDDILNNIFDLGSNVREWTQEAYSSVYRANRGGVCHVTDTNTASTRFRYNPTVTSGTLGSRLSLYLR